MPSDALLLSLSKAIGGPRCDTYYLHAALITFFVSQSVLAKESCNAQSMKGGLCLCELSDLHPTQTSVGMAEVRIKAEKLKDELQHRGERNFLKYLLKHEKEEPVIIGPGSVFYITIITISHEHSMNSASRTHTASSSTIYRTRESMIFGNAWKTIMRFT
jgi:hypothetical protein